MDDLLISLGNARDKARRHHFMCLCPGCTKKAINSHLVQQHPFLESIAEEGYLFQILDNEISPMSGDFDDLKGRKLSIRNSLSFPLFCSEHDDRLFKTIESGPFDEISLDSFLRFSFRALASQRYLEEKRLIFYKNTGLEGPLYDIQKENSKYVIERIEFTLKLLLTDIDNKSFDNYVFNVVNFPYLPVCGSDVILDEGEMVDSYEDCNSVCRPINGIYITLIPYSQEKVLKVFIGYNKKFVGEKQIEFYKKVTKKNLDNIFELLSRIKNWCCSPSIISDSNFVENYELIHNDFIWEGGC